MLAFPVPAAPATSPAAPAAAGHLDVRRAVYEAVDGGPSADVTAKIVALLQAGQASVVAANDALGGDPAAGQLKQLRLEFTLDGRPGTLVVDEHETLIFPVDAAHLARARAAERTAVSRTFVQPMAADPADVAAFVRRGDVVELTGRLAADGRLSWDVPPGRWVVLRVGYTAGGRDEPPGPGGRPGAGVRQAERGRVGRPLGRVHAAGAGRRRPAGRAVAGTRP